MSAPSLALGHVMAVAAVFYDRRIELLKTVGERVSPKGELIDVTQAVAEKSTTDASLRLLFRTQDAVRQSIVLRVPHETTALPDPTEAADSLDAMLKASEPIGPDDEPRAVVYLKGSSKAVYV